MRKLCKYTPIAVVGSVAFAVSLMVAVLMLAGTTMAGCTSHDHCTNGCVLTSGGCPKNHATVCQKAVEGCESCFCMYVESICQCGML